MTAAAVAVTAWGFGSVLIKTVRLGGLALAFNRLWMAAVVLVVVLYASGRGLDRRSLRASLPGGLAFGLNVSLFFLAVKHTSVADANIISALQPAVLLVLVGPLFAEQVTPATVGWTAVAIGGVALAVFASARGAGRTAGGDLLACAALGTWVWYFVASKRARRELGALEYQTGLTLVAACVVTPLALASGQRLTMPDAATVGWVALIVAVPGGGHLLMNWAHGYAPLTLTSQLTLAVPVVAIVAAVVFLGEPVTALQLVGLAVVLGALAIVLRTSMRVLPVAPEPGAP